MRKLFFGLIVLVLMMMFAMPAAAVDMSVNGEFYVQGYYDDNGDLLKEETGANGSSSAWYNTRLRVDAVLTVDPSLKLVTRFDALEGYWNTPGGPAEYDAGREDDNIDFDRAYIDLKTKYGRFFVGYQCGGTWGTWFANKEIDVARIKYYYFNKGLVCGGIIEKNREGDQGTDLTDADNDKYYLYAIKYFKGGQVGILYGNIDYAAWKSTARFDMHYHLIYPYLKWKVGNIYVEAELNYAFGDSKVWDDGIAADDVDKKGLSWYVNGKYSFGNAYVGGQIAFVQGDDPDTADEDESGPTGSDYDPCLILWNSDLVKWSGQNLGHGPTSGDSMANSWLYQIYAGMSVNPKIDIVASYSYATADEDANLEDDEIGSEIDVTATYKVFENLEYMVGFGYFMAGDYYKANKSDEVDNDYVVMHKLILTF